MNSVIIISSIVLFAVSAKTAPPAVCSANFRWEDCGRPPEPVIYYWKAGSRCEVGIWRGCMPNPNMFKDEFECASACIFTLRAKLQNFHSQQLIDNLTNVKEFTDSDNPKGAEYSNLEVLRLNEQKNWHPNEYPELEQQRSKGRLDSENPNMQTALKEYDAYYN